MKCKSNQSIIAGALLAASIFLPETAGASLYTSSIGNLVTGYSENDDGSFGALSLGFNINFFGTSYGSLYVNNNGNVTFGGSTSSYSPLPLNTQSTRPMIAPYWTDLDSRSSLLASSGVYLTQSEHQTIVTWKDMGYFNRNYSGMATFQLVLNDPSTAVAGQVIGFFYGDLSSGTDSHQVTAGFGDGLSSVGSGEVSYATGSSAAVSAQLNQTSQWFGLDNGTPVATVPLPGAMGLLGSAILGIIGLSRRRHHKAFV